MLIHCCGCGCKVAARLTTGYEIYPHRTDLKSLSFWICDICGNYVGCHRKGKKGQMIPLGCIPTEAVRKARRNIHMLLDPIWKSGRLTKKALYTLIGYELGWKYHTANIRSVDEANKVCCIIRDILQALKRNV